MKAVFALAASLSLASASILPRQLDQIPQCALSCALGSLQSTGCQTTDFACICQATAFVTSLLPCVQAGCSAAEIDNTIQAAQQLCAGAGVTLSIPTGAAETTSAAPSTSSEAAATTTEADVTTTAPSTETSAATTSAGAETSASTSEAPATTVPGNATQTSGTRPPTPTGTEPGAASRNTVALGGLGAIVALVAAFL